MIRKTFKMLTILAAFAFSTMGLQGCAQDEQGEKHVGQYSDRTTTDGAKY